MMCVWHFSLASQTIKKLPCNIKPVLKFYSVHLKKSARVKVYAPDTSKKRTHTKYIPKKFSNRSGLYTAHLWKNWYFSLKIMLHYKWLQNHNLRIKIHYKWLQNHSLETRVNYKWLQKLGSQNQPWLQMTTTPWPAQYTVFRKQKRKVLFLPFLIF